MAVAATKIDSKDDGKRVDLLRDYCKTNNIDFFEISAVANMGLRELTQYLSDKAADGHEEEQAEIKAAEALNIEQEPEPEIITNNDNRIEVDPYDEDN